MDTTGRKGTEMDGFDSWARDSGETATRVIDGDEVVETNRPMVALADRMSYLYDRTDRVEVGARVAGHLYLENCYAKGYDGYLVRLLLADLSEARCAR